MTETQEKILDMMKWFHEFCQEKDNKILCRWWNNVRLLWSA